MNPPNPQQDKLDQLITEFREEYGNCLDWIFDELNEPENLGYSELLLELFKPYTNVMGGVSLYPIISIIFWFWNGPKFFDKDSLGIKKFQDRMKPKKLALEYLPTNSVEIIPPKLYIKNVHYNEFINCYFWLERLYYISAHRNLHWEDTLDIYFSGVIERLIFGLDEFDKLDTIPDPNCEFFHKLGKVKVHDDSEKFKAKIGKIIQTSMEQKQFKQYTLFKNAEDKFLDCLAAFSTVNSDREYITIDDYLTAYITYYKLLKTDLSQYNCKKEILNDKYHGYLVCDSCNSFYELKRGEKPDDFTNCHCTGQLKYVKYLENKTDIKWKSVLIYCFLLALILLSSFKLFYIFYWMIVGIFFLILATGLFSIIDERDKRGSVLGTSVSIILSYLLSSLVIKLYFNDSGNYMVLFIPMCLILALDLVIILKTRL